MKKLIILAIVVFNLLPCLKDGKLTVGTNEAYSQVAGGVYSGPNGTYIGQAYGSSWGGSSNVYYYNGSSGYFTVYAVGTDPNGIPLGYATIQGTIEGQSGGGGGGSSGGEGYGDEDGGFDGDIGWDIDDPWGDDGGDGGGGGPGDQQPPRDCHGDNWGSAYENNCRQCVEGNTGIPDTCTKGSDEYYLTLNNYATKYRNKDTIYIPWQQTPIKLTVHKESGPVEPHDYRWKRNDTANNLCNQNVECNFAANRLGADEIKIDSNNTKLIIKATLVTYRPPVIYFQKGDNYMGEYAFDDSTHQYANIATAAQYRNGYQIRRMRADTAYFVPWMSLLHNRSATIKIRKLWPDSALILKDVNTKLVIKPSDTAIKVNNAFSYTINYDQLNTFDTLRISARRWNTNVLTNYNIGRIDANQVTNISDTMGRLRLSCAIPSMKNVTIVYVNIGTGYDSSVLGKTKMIDSLNNHGHNQIFRRWNLGTTYTGLLNISTEYGANPAAFTANTSAFDDSLRVIYQRKTGTDIYGINGGVGTSFTNFAGKKHFIFVTKALLPASTSTTGATRPGGVITVLYRDANYTTVRHEIGHILKLGHTWLTPYFIPQYSTANLMDYEHSGEHRRNKFDYFSWRDCF